MPKIDSNRKIHGIIFFSGANPVVTGKAQEPWKLQPGQPKMGAWSSENSAPEQKN